MKNIIYLSAFALLALSATTACNDNKKSKNYNQKTEADSDGLAFIKQVNEAGMTEVQAATVAQSKSKNPRVIRFAKMMIDDHTAMGEKLKELAANNDVPIKSAADTLSVEHQQMINGISKLSGAAFDKAYMQMMVADHGKVVELFKVATNNQTKTIDNFAEKSLPVMLKHLDSAKAINSSL